MEVPADLAAVERAMVAIRNRQRRRSLLRLAERSGEIALDPALYEVIDAIESAEGAGEPLTVTALAERLGTDQPHASRLAARTVEKGLACRRVDQRDGRRALLSLTETGRRHTIEMRSNRRMMFSRAMGHWSQRERAEFARLLTSFVASLERIETEPAPERERSRS